MPLTPKEKKALKAEKKAEKKRKAAEKKKQLKRDVLARELKYSAVTYKKHEKEWRQLLIEKALPGMRDDLEFAWHNFERVIDCKDFTISLLMDEIRDAEEQYMLNAKNHVEHIDKLIDMFRERLEELAADNEAQLISLQERCEKEMKEINEYADEEDNYLKTIVYMLEVAQKKQKQQVRAEYFSKLQEEDTKGSQLISRLRGVLDMAHVGLDTDTRNFLEAHYQHVKEKQKLHDDLKVRDEAMQKVLQAQLDHIRKSMDRIRALKIRLRESQKMLGRRVADLDNEHVFFLNAFNLLKRKLILDRAVDFQKLQTLTVNFDATKQALEKLQIRGEHILHVAAVCRKLETQEEKILPFPCTNNPERVAIDYIPEYIADMEYFWQRVGQAEASRYAILEEKEFLKTENEILKIKVHRYCQCLTCPVEKKNVAMQTKVMYVTEGTLEQKKYEMHDNNDQFGTASENSSIMDEEFVF